MGSLIQKPPALLLDTVAGGRAGTLRDPALPLWVEMVPRQLQDGDCTPKAPPCLECGACSLDIVSTVLIREASHREPNKRKPLSRYFHPHCVCADCEEPILDSLKVPWASDTLFYHPDCCCQHCYEPIFPEEEAAELERQAANSSSSSSRATQGKHKKVKPGGQSQEVDKSYRYYATGYRFHARCPKIKSPPFNATICASCECEIHKDTDLREGPANGKPYHAWCMTPNWIFKTRLREAESRAYYDHEAHIKAIFAVDWKKCLKRKSLFGLLNECKCDARKLRRCIQPFYEKLCDLYDMYSGFGRFNADDPDDCFELQQNEVKAWATDAGVFGGDVSWNRLFTFFLAANVEVDTEENVADMLADDDGTAAAGGSTAAAAGGGADDGHAVSHTYADDEGIDMDDADNDDSSLVRFEFLLFVILCAHARYYAQSSEDLVSAVEKFFTKHVAHIRLGAVYEHLPQFEAVHPTVHRPNDFRANCLYTRDVHLVLSQHARFLQSVFAFYSGHDGRKNELKIDRWFEFVRDVALIDQDSSERDLLLCFCYSRMRVRDEMKDRARVTKLTFTGFLESLCRIAFAKNIPLFALIIADKVELSVLPKGEALPVKWLEAAFMREEMNAGERLEPGSPPPWGKHVDNLAQNGVDHGWDPSEAPHRVDILIKAIKHMFEVRKDWHVRAKFPPLSAKQVRVLESRDTKASRRAPASASTPMQLWEPDQTYGKAILDRDSTGEVKGLTDVI